MTVQEFYTAIGSDYNEIMGRLGNEDRIRRFLKKMLETGDMAALKEAWARQDAAQIFSYSHRLKGNAQNLSLNWFIEMTSALTEAFRNGPAQNMDAATEMYKALCEEYDSLSLYINQIE